MALTKVKAGNIILTTPAASSNDVTPATTQYVTTALANLADSAPATLNTLNELAAALGDDANFSTTVTNNIATKLPLAGGTMTGALGIGGNPAATQMLDIVKNHSASTRAKITNNTGNSASHSELMLQTGGGASGDPFINFNNEVVNFAMGVDNSDSDKFKISNNATLGTNDRFVIINTGNVGINNTNPDRKVSIIGDSTSEGQYPLSLDATNTDYTLEFRRNGQSEWWIAQAGSAFRIHENGVGDHFRLNSGGNLGLGTSPAARLHVSGSSDGNLTSAIFANTVQGGTNDTVAIELQLAGTSGQVAAGTLRAGKGEDWTSGTSRSGFLAIEAVLDGTNRQMAYFGSDGDGSSIVRFSTANVERVRLESNGIMSLGNGSNRRPFAVQSNMGYASSYKATVIGSASTNYNTGVTGATSICFNYDPSGNGNGSFGGNGGEIWFRRSTAIKTPNAADNGFFTQFSMTDGVTSGDFNDTSDRNLKENITSITNGYDVIKDLNPVTFNWKDANKGNGLGGFIAQEVETVLPNDVFGEDYAEGDRGEPLTDGKSINTTSIVAHLVKAVQELEARIKELEG